MKLKIASLSLLFYFISSILFAQAPNFEWVNTFGDTTTTETAIDVKVDDTGNVAAGIQT